MSQQNIDEQNEEELEIKVPQTFGQRRSIPDEEREKNHSNLEYSLSLEKNDAQSQQVFEQQHRGSDVEVIEFAASNFNFEKTKKDNFFQDEEHQNNKSKIGPKESDAQPNYQNVYSNNSQHNENNFLNQVQPNPFGQENFDSIRHNPIVNNQKVHPTPKVNNFQSHPEPIYLNQGQIMPLQQQPPPIEYHNQILPTQYASPFNGYYNNNQGQQFNNNGQHKKKKKRRDSDSDSDDRRCHHNQGYVQTAVIVPVNRCNGDPIAVNLASNVAMYCCLGLFNQNDNCCQWMCDCIVYLLTFPIILFKKLVECIWGCCMKDLCSVGCPKCHEGCSQGCGILVSSVSRCCISLKSGVNECCMSLLSICCSCINFAALGTYLAENCRKFWRDSGALIGKCAGAIGSCCLVFGEQFGECCCAITGKLLECLEGFMKIFGDVICKLCEIIAQLLKCF